MSSGPIKSSGRVDQAWVTWCACRRFCEDHHHERSDLAFGDRTSADQAWDDFRADPDWVKAKADSEVDGALTERVDSVFLDPTDYSPIR
jgi:hypothetical protein